MPFNFVHRLSHDAAESIASYWWMLLLNGLVLITAGVLIFAIDWTVSTLAFFIGALFIVEGITIALTTGFDATVRLTNVVAGILSVAAGIAIMVWPAPGLVAVAIFLGAWLIVMGTVAITGSLAARHIVSDWWMWLIVGLLEVPLGVLALADPGATLVALVTVSGIWAVAIGVTRVVLAFEVKRLPRTVDEAFASPAGDARTSAVARAGDQFAAAAR